MSRKRRGRLPRKDSVLRLPQSVRNDIARLAAAGRMTAREIDARLGLAEKGVRRESLAKMVSRARRAAGVRVGPGQAGGSRASDALAASLLAYLTLAHPAPMVDSFVRRLAYLYHVNLDEIARLAGAPRKMNGADPVTGGASK